MAAGRWQAAPMRISMPFRSRLPAHRKRGADADRNQRQLPAEDAEIGG
jgi:hypothetical protein